MSLHEPHRQHHPHRILEPDGRIDGVAFAAERARIVIDLVDAPGAYFADRRVTLDLHNVRRLAFFPLRAEVPDRLRMTSVAVRPRREVVIDLALQPLWVPQ